MDPERAAAGLGIAGCTAVLALAAAPYLLADPGAVGVYYAPGPVGPPVVGLLAAIVAIALAAGVRRRSDPALVAGVAVVLSLFGAGLGTAWALAVSPSVVGGFTTVSEFEYHRWAFAAATLVVLAGSAWYARAVLAAGD